MIKIQIGSQDKGVDKNSSTKHNIHDFRMAYSSTRILCDF